MNLRTATCLLATALLAAGCITPETRVRTQTFTQLSAPRPGPVRRLAVHAHVRGSDIGVQAQYRRSCVRPVPPAGAHVTACPLAADGLPVELAFASGTTLRGTTDARGTYQFSVPPGEPARGVVILRAPGVQPQELRY